jgi:hypothetical protein
MSKHFGVQVGDIAWLDPTAGGSIPGSNLWPKQEQSHPFLILETNEHGGAGRNSPFVMLARSVGTGYMLETRQGSNGWSNLWFRKDEFLTAAYQANKTLDASEDQTYDVSCPNPPQP